MGEKKKHAQSKSKAQAPKTRGKNTTAVLVTTYIPAQIIMLPKISMVAIVKNHSCTFCSYMWHLRHISFPAQAVTPRLHHLIPSRPKNTPPHEPLSLTRCPCLSPYLHHTQHGQTKESASTSRLHTCVRAKEEPTWIRLETGWTMVCPSPSKDGSKYTSPALDLQSNRSLRGVLVLRKPLKAVGPRSHPLKRDLGRVGVWR